MRVLLSLIVVAVLAGVAGYGGWTFLNTEMSRPGPADEVEVFVVEPGEGLASIAARLEDDGLIRDARVLRLAARIQGVERGAKVGEYAFGPATSAEDILAQIVDGDVVTYKITIPEGRTTAQILRQLEEHGILEGELPETPPAEGALLPDTYEFQRGSTRQDLIDRMAQAQDDLLSSLWDARAEGLPITTPEEAVILASVVEKETGVVDERGLIAGVFVNRLNRGMRLQSDPTIIYGVSRGEPLYNSKGQRRTLYRSEIDRKTDWNTYQIDGLPITPICNPGRQAIAAVLNPETTDFLFFVADGTGGHAFARTNNEHLRNVATYRRIEAQRIAAERAQ